MKLRFLLLALLITACQEPSEIFIDEYYKLNDFWLGQKDKLESSKPTFAKTIKMDGSENTVQTSDINWKRELEIFMSTDINRSAMRGCYDEVKEGNNLIYTLKSDKEQAVRKIEITLENEKPILVKAKMLTENFLYSSSRSISANFVEGQLSEYTISGSQELFIGTKKDFFIKAKRVE
jgi:hypothetical protein